MRRHRFYSKMIFAIAAMFITAALSASESIGNVDCSEWAKIVCGDLGSMSIGCGAPGGNIYAHGLITDQRPLEKLGFNFGQGSYRMTAKRLSEGRYVISIQSMTRRDDNFEKEVALITKADAEYPGPQSGPVPYGKYRLNMAIKYDMREQLGVMPWYEKVDKIVYFIDIRVLEPEKLAEFGIHGMKRGESSVQMLYLGNNRWKINKPMGQIGPILVYESAKWSSEGEARQAAEAAPDARLSHAAVSPAALPVLPSMQSNPVIPKQKTSHASNDSLLFPNSDFEQGDLRNWTASDNAFQYQPTMGDNPTARRRMKHPSKHQGNFWIGTYEKYGGGDGERPGGIQGDQPTGALTSIPFEIRGEQISFLIGGGEQPNNEYVALVVDANEVRKATAGKNNESMHSETWDVNEFSGKMATILICDHSSRGWGHINTDYFHFTGMIRPPSGDISPAASESGDRDRLPYEEAGSSLIPTRAGQYDSWFPLPPQGWTAEPAGMVSMGRDMLQVQKYYVRRHDNARMRINVVAHPSAADTSAPNDEIGSFLTQTMVQMSGGTIQGVNQQGYPGIITVENSKANVNFRISAMNIFLMLDRPDRKAIMDYVKRLNLKTATELFMH